MITTTHNPAYRFIHLSKQDAFEHLAADIAAGLSASEKYIPYKYLYDAQGSELFEKIARDPHYYPTRSETEILSLYAAEIAGCLADDTALIELGSGSAPNTRRLLEALLHRRGTALFCPIDISGDFLQESVKRLSMEYPNLHILGVIGDYYDGLAALEHEIQQPKLLLWLGSDIGHTDRLTAALLLREKMLPTLKADDRLLLAIDLKKDADVLHRAYGCTEEEDALRYSFNCNLLRRINRELDGDFVPEQFKRFCFYNAEAGRVEIYLKSLIQQQVNLRALDKRFNFKPGELICLHRAYKYDRDDIRELAIDAGMTLERQWSDKKGWYSLNLFSVRTD
jgi:dimethylhistidine N-methyltransferase